MTHDLPRSFAGAIAMFGALTASCCLADPRVIVSATASPEYTQRKFSDGKVAPESYVVMQGRFFEGNIVDRSIDRMPFRHIAEVFAPELAKRQYWPAKDPKEANLLIVVHWGTTTPRMSTMEMKAQTSPMPNVSAARENKQMRMESAGPNDFVGGLLAEHMSEDSQLLQLEHLDQLGDQIANDYSSANSAELLGYSKTLHQYTQRALQPAEEYALRQDLGQMRYFIILRAYDLRAATPAERRRAVWTLHLNVSSPGNSFDMAIDRMSLAAMNYVGRSTDTVQTVLPRVREGKVEIGPVVILGEAK